MRSCGSLSLDSRWSEPRGDGGQRRMSPYRPHLPSGRPQPPGPPRSPPSQLLMHHPSITIAGAFLPRARSILHPLARSASATHRDCDTQRHAAAMIRTGGKTITLRTFPSLAIPHPLPRCSTPSHRFAPCSTHSSMTTMPHACMRTSRTHRARSAVRLRVQVARRPAGHRRLPPTRTPARPLSGVRPTRHAAGLIWSVD